MSKLVCSMCEIEFKPVKNGVEVVEFSDNGPYKLWEADEWECPDCNIRVVTGFAQQPTHRNDDPASFDAQIAYANAHDLRRNDYEDTAQRDHSQDGLIPIPNPCWDKPEDS